MLAAPFQITFPLAPADAYGWPGGYPIGYVMDDGELLCARCMNDDANPVHAGGDADGWRLEGLAVLEDSSAPADCAHCGRVLVVGESGDDVTDLLREAWQIEGPRSLGMAQGPLEACETFYLHGTADDVSGDVEAPTGHFYRVARWIVRTDSQGFKDLEELETEDEARAAFETLETEYDAWSSPPAGSIELSICVDCLMYLANGEATNEHGDDITHEHAARIDAVWQNEPYDITLGGDDEGGFSWTQCDGCHSNLGGDRYTAYAIPRDNH
jgi:hypothetical protein